MWGILERKGKRDCKRFAFISDFSCQSCGPQSFPRAATMHHYCQCDCSYRLPSRYYLSFTSAREAEIPGRTFLLEQIWLQGTTKDCKGQWVTWLDSDFILLKVRFWWWHGASLTMLSGYERSHESRCWVGGNGGKHGVQKHKEGTKQKCMDDSELAEFTKESCWTGLFRMGRGQESSMSIDNTADTFLSENKRWLLKFDMLQGAAFHHQLRRFVGEKKISRYAIMGWMNQWDVNCLEHCSSIHCLHYMPVSWVRVRRDT